MDQIITNNNILVISAKVCTLNICEYEYYAYHYRAALSILFRYSQRNKIVWMVFFKLAT